ncbi:MAG: TIR domain-containing protein, partial [Cytophagaceae bacterium]|nr:TIR domain-containing protein [Cytophagaceae bacterium]
MNIFLSYNRKNGPFVAQIATQLRSLNMGMTGEMFFDQDNLDAGQVWADKIQEALVNCDACVVFIGEQGIGNWQRKEVLEAINLLEKRGAAFRIIPVIVPHSNRENVQKSFPWFLSDIQWIEFIGPSDSDAFLKLVEALRTGSSISFPFDKDAKPYKGLESFGIDDAAFFFGRSFDINRVFYYHLRLASSGFGKRFLAIVGSSGSGKSSFARAGLLASLKAGRFEGSAQWKQVVFTPDDQPLLNLAVALESAGIIPNASDFKNGALQDPEALRERLGVFGHKVVLLIDQFEEVVTQCKNPAIQTAFLNNLTEAVKSEHLVCIVTMRSDFYSSFAPYREFNHLLLTNNYTLAELDADTSGEDWGYYLRDIIRKPAWLLGVRVEPVLVGQLIEDLRDINGVLPALQLALKQLWLSRKHADRIASEDYDSLARGRGISGVIEEHANTVFNTFTKKGTDPQRVALFKAIFIRLVEITGGKDDVRKTISRKKLGEELAYGFSEEQILEMLEDLYGEQSRLIRVKGKGADSTIEVIHEVLIRKWEKLKGWINERREAIAYKQILENDIRQYENKAGNLYSGRSLKTAITWQKRNSDLTDARTKSFIAKGQNQQRARVFGSVAVMMIGILGGVWYYFGYLPKNSGIAGYWKDRNYRLEDVHQLRLTNLEDLTYLPAFTNLDTLVIDAGNQIFNQAHVDRLPDNLVFLSIENVEINAPLNFRTLSSIKFLTLSNIAKLYSYSDLQHLTSLHTLTLKNVPNLRDLKGLEQANSLHTLTLSSLANLRDLKGLEQANSLHTLTLSGLAIPDLKGLEQARSLHTLRLSSLANLRDLKGLEQADSLHTLTLSNLAIPDLKGLEQANSLRTLTLFALANLRDLKGLEQA